MLVAVEHDVLLLQGAAAAAWELLGEGASETMLTDAAAQEYDIPAGDLRDALEHLAAQSLCRRA